MAKDMNEAVVCFPARTFLGRQLKFLAFQHLGDVQVEEVAVEDGLDAPGDDCDDIVKS